MLNHSSLNYIKQEICIILISVLCLFAESVSARTIKVPSEYKSIQQAVYAAKNGDQVKIAAGIYKENISVPHKISILGEGVKTTVITPLSSLPTPIFSIFDDCIVSGLTIKKAKAGSVAAILIKNCSPRISNCIITDNRDSGIVIQNGNKTIISYNKITINFKSGIEVIGGSPLISNNRIFANQYSGITNLNASSQIENNLIYKNLQYGISCVNNSQLVEPKKKNAKPVPRPKPMIKNNTIKDNIGGEILCRQSSPEIEGNTIGNDAGRAILLFYSDAVIKKNKIKSNGPPPIRIQQGSPVIEQKVISGIFRFPILGENGNGSIKDNKIELMLGPLLKLQQQNASQAKSEK